MCDPFQSSADLATLATRAAVRSQQQEVVGPGEWAGKGSRLMLQSWRFVVVWLTLPDLGPFLQALFLLPGTIPGLDAKNPEFSVLGRGNREKGLSWQSDLWGRGWRRLGVRTGRVPCGGTGTGCGLRAPVAALLVGELS